MENLYEQVKALVDFAENPVKRVGTGMRPIDSVIGGPAPGEICLIIARSYAGKSVVGQNIINNNKDKASIFFSMEMPKVQAIMRMYSIWSDTSAQENQHYLEKGFVDPAVWDMVLDFPKHHIDDRAALTLDEMSFRIDSFVDRYGTRPHFVVIDYLELLGGAKASGDGLVAVEQQATKLKDWAKQQEMRVFVLHQTNRQEPKHKPPTENSARFGGYTEADFVIGLWRPHTDPGLEYWDQMAIKNHINFNILKNRAFGEDRSLIPMRLTPSLRIVEP